MILILISILFLPILILISIFLPILILISIFILILILISTFNTDTDTDVVLLRASEEKRKSIAVDDSA